jgi:glutathione S-transferase
MMADMPPRDGSQTYLLLSMAVSHYNEKARWALAYYQVPYTQHLLLPWLHIFTVKPIVDSNVCTQEKRDTRASPWSTPCLAVYDASGSKLQESFHDSHDILVYLSEKFSCPDHMNLYASCGPAKVDEIKALERHYDEGLGVAAIDFFYLDALVFNKWHSMLPFALMGFRNRVGPLQSLIWFIFSPLLGRMLISVMGITASRYQKAMQTCREEFKHASECESSLYLISRGNSTF